MTNAVQNKSPHRMNARLFGIFFILTFLSFGVGMSLIDSVTSGPDFMANLQANTPTIITGAMLMAVAHTFFNLMLPALMMPVLKPHNQILSYGYLGTAIAATTILAIGALMLLLLVPLGQEYLAADVASHAHFDTLGAMLTTGGNQAYHMGMAVWAIGGLMFAMVLYQSKLIPRLMSVWGLVGYLTLLIGSISEIFGHNNLVEIISVTPGGLFEVTLSLWLIFKGFNAPKPTAATT